MMKEAFKDERRFAEGASAYAKYFKNIHALNEYFNASSNMGNFIKKEPNLVIIVRREVTRLDTRNVLKMMWWEHMDKDKFSGAILNIVNLKVATL